MQIAEIPREEMRNTRLVQDWLDEGDQEEAASVTVGVVNIAEWGDDPKADTNPYGVATVAWPLQPNNHKF